MGLFKNLIGLGMNAAMSQINYNYAERSARNTYNRQLEFWNKQNTYNSPANQKQLYESAGYSPQAALDGFNSSAQPLSQVASNEYAQKGVIDPSAAVDWLKSFSEIEQISAGTNKLTAEVATEYLEQALLALEIPKAKVDAIIAETKARFSEQREYAEIESILASARASRSSAGLSDEQAATERELRQPRKESIEAETKLTLAKETESKVSAAFKAIESDILDKYGRQDAKARAKLSIEQVKEFINNTTLRRDLLEAGVTKEQADAAISLFSSWLKSDIANPADPDYGSIESLARAFFNNFLEFK